MFWSHQQKLLHTYVSSLNVFAFCFLLTFASRYCLPYSFLKWFKSENSRKFQGFISQVTLPIGRLSVIHSSATSRPLALLPTQLPLTPLQQY